jgi:hypothetical protein
MDIVKAGRGPVMLSVCRCSALQHEPEKWNDFSVWIGLGFKVLQRHMRLHGVGGDAAAARLRSMERQWK